ncbi:MAG: peptidase S8, partial [Verrucomicrobia bacterium]
MDALNHNPNIEFAEPDTLFPPATVPNDTYYSLEWHLPKIGAPSAWNTTVGGNNIIIAILDSGVDSTHPDLSSQLVPGWNFIDNNSDASDVDGHGTAVAGTAAAASNDGLGVAAPAWTCKIMPIRISDTNGNGILSAIANGLMYAADHGARIANLSFGASTSL